MLDLAELILFFCLLFSGSIMMSMMFIYIYELFPMQTTAMALGAAQISLCTANIILPSIILILNAVNFPTMAIFCLIAIVIMCALCPMPETLGAEPVELAEDVDPFEDNCDL
jgi:hypothetical protein